MFILRSSFRSDEMSSVAARGRLKNWGQNQQNTVPRIAWE
jgi:hypothetical protein